MDAMKFLSLIPAALQLTQAIESQVSGKGQGQKKLGAALTVAGQIFDQEEQIRAEWDSKDDFITNFRKAIGHAVTLSKNLTEKPVGPTPKV